MTTRDLNNWIMYHEIHKLNRLGFSNPKIADYLVLDTRTVKKYLSMSEEEYGDHLSKGQFRSKVLSPYESFVRDKLNRFTQTSAAQIHDWLKEHHPGFPETNPRTVYNFVMFVRRKHNIPIVKVPREYFPIQELPYGEQAQIDFGHYNMRQVNGKRKKISFFAIVLSRSRMKYVWFWDRSYTALDVCEAHERAFSFYGGIPATIVYDQDRTMVVDENIGDVILTATFKQYTKSRSFKLHFCRKSDPESKGKIENVVQYVKKNFLYNRSYWDIETLNTEASSWLARTANALGHNFTKKIPQKEYDLEKQYLNPYTPLAIEDQQTKTYHVRKTNAIAYKSNFYSVPMGTYKGTGTLVAIKEAAGILEIYSTGQELICSHKISSGKGQFIANTNHKRDTSKSLDQMILQVTACFTEGDKAARYLQKINLKLPRYLRDHLQAMLKALEGFERQAADKALDFCMENEILSGYDFEQVLFVSAPPLPVLQQGIRLLDKNNLEKARQAPEKSDLRDYENIINQ